MSKQTPLEELSRSDLIKRADKVFSKYIRLSWANNNGMCQCYTCPKVIFWLYIQNGHFQSRGIFALRFEEDNCRPQCFECNGNMDSRRTATYQLKLIEDVGNERVLELLQIASSHKEWLVEKQYYIDIVHHYQKEVLKLLSRIPAKLYT